MQLKQHGQSLACEFPSFEYISSFAESYPERHVEIAEFRNGPIFAFALDGEVATSIVPMMPHVGQGTLDDTDLLDGLLRQLRVSHLVFPLVYRDDARTKALCSVQGTAVFGRRPSPIIDWSQNGVDIDSRLQERLGSRYRRRRRAFERRSFTVLAIDDCDAAAGIVRDVEKQSWKARCGQDMLSRRQFSLYESLLRRQVLKATAVIDAGRPVAYRLDGFAGSVVVCVKWSYDDAYAKTSPGFYLIACDVPRRYGERSLSHIDLFGGEDTLKCVVMSGSVGRVDVVYPGDEKAPELVRDGLRLDRQVAAHLPSGRGLRYFYDGGASRW
jgi:hypothetical protein